MGNTIEYSKIFQPALDKQVVAESTTGWMENNAGQVIYNGGDEIKIPSIVMDGLTDYDRSTGFTDGDITLTYKTHKMTQDRGRSFSLDAMDVDETNFVATAGTVMGEFQKVQVVPEIDAYRYSKLATLAKNAKNSRDLTVTSANLLDELLKDLAVMEDKIGNKDVVITMNPIIANMLGIAGKELLSKAQLLKGEISVEVSAFNDNAIVKAPSNILVSAIEIKTAGSGGFKPAVGSQKINWLIATKDAPIAISKTDKVRIFTPDQNQKADAYKMDYRKYHDLWVPANKLPCIYVNLAPGA